MTKTYSEMTLDELLQEKQELKDVIRHNEIANDSYYLSPESKEYRYALSLVNREIEMRQKTDSQLATDIMKGFLGC